jgi:hypothetical protein
MWKPQLQSQTRLTSTKHVKGIRTFCQNTQHGLGYSQISWGQPKRFESANKTPNRQTPTPDSLRQHQSRPIVCQLFLLFVHVLRHSSCCVFFLWSLCECHRQFWLFALCFKHRIFCFLVTSVHTCPEPFWWLLIECVDVLVFLVVSFQICECPGGPNPIGILNGFMNISMHMALDEEARISFEFFLICIGHPIQILID